MHKINSSVPHASLRPPCVDFADIEGLNGSDRTEYAGLLAVELLTEANGQMPPWKGHVDFNVQVHDAKRNVEDAPTTTSVKDAALQRIEGAIDDAGISVVAGDVLAIRGCAKCIQGPECTIKTVLEGHRSTARKAQDAIGAINREQEYPVKIQKLANAFGKYSAAERRSRGFERGIEHTSAIRSRILSQFLEIPTPEERDAAARDIFRVLSDRNKEDFPRFINGLVTEAYVFEELRAAEEQYGWKVRTTSSNEDVQGGTDILLQLDDDQQVVRIDAKTRGAFENLQTGGELHQLDGDGHFGIRIVQDKPVLVINPEGTLIRNSNLPVNKLGKRGPIVMGFRCAGDTEGFAEKVNDAIVEVVTPKAQKLKAA
jgi:hypothetical protein